MIRVLGLGLLMSLGLTRMASGQFGTIVHDPINNIPITVTAVQSTISAVEAVIHTAKWIIEQTPLG